MQGPLEKVDKMKVWLSTKGSPKSTISGSKFTNEGFIDKAAFKKFTVKR